MKLLAGSSIRLAHRRLSLQPAARLPDKNSNVIQLNDSSKSKRNQKSRAITIGSICLLVVPAITFVFGVWQVQRYKLRVSLIEQLKQEFPPNSPDFPTAKLRVLEEKRNHNVAYYLTWFGLSASTSAMWYTRFVMKR